MKRVPLFLRVLPVYIVLALAIYYPFYSENQKKGRIVEAVQASENVFAEEEPKPVRISGTPIRIVIPSLNIDLPIVQGKYDTSRDVWSVSDTKANYAVNTPLINNESGKTLIYGHNNRYVFAKLLNMEKGKAVYIYTSNDHVFKYTYVGTKTIEPTDTALFDKIDEGDPGVKLMTCSGAWYQNRTILNLSLEKAR